MEFRSAADIARQYPNGVRRLADGGTWNTLAGQPTDDSEMALMLARSIVRADGYDVDEALAGYVHWYRSSPFDMGSTTRAALAGAASVRWEGTMSAIDRGRRTDAALAASNRASQANGSLMRCSPIGILGWRHPELASSWAREDSTLTHPHEVSREACAAYVAAISVAIRTGRSVQAFEVAYDFARVGECDEVVDALHRARVGPPNDFSRLSGWVLTAFHNAFYQLLHAPTLEEGVVSTVMSGGDTDTNGCIAGALLGAVYGESAVPYQWRHAVLTCRPDVEAFGVAHPRPREFWPVDAIDLADRLIDIGSTR